MSCRPNPPISDFVGTYPQARVTIPNAGILEFGIGLEEKSDEHA